MLAFTLANLKMMARNRQATFWALFFPLLLVVVFGLLDIDALGSAKMAVIDQAGTIAAQRLRDELGAIDFLTMEETPSDLDGARRRVIAGELDYLLIIPEGFGDTDPGTAAPAQVPVSLMYRSSNQGRNQLVDGVVRNRAAEARAGDTAAHPSLLVASQVVNVSEASYFDLVLMGLIGLGVMTNSIISIAVRISTYRNNSILKRLLVTPLPIWKYFASEIAAHLVLATVQAAIILAVGVLVFGARIHGNAAWIFVIVPLGSLVFLNIGFILSAWARTPAAASGMGNAVALPMMFFAGTFFSTGTLPWVLPFLAEALPLTPMLSALREVAIDNAPIWDTWPQLLTLGGWAVATALVATRVFRFN